MQISSRIVLASHNAGKIQEIRSLLSDLSLEVISQAEFAIGDIPETAPTFIENALLKARYVTEKTGLPAIADDSGLEVDALNGAPGIYTARYAGEPSNAVNNIEKLLQEMQGITNRRARFRSVCVLLRHAQDPAPVIAEGIWEGEILTAPRGQQGFGYDPVFYVPEYQCAAAELAFEVKNQCSHRAKALTLLKQKVLSLRA